MSHPVDPRGLAQAPMAIPELHAAQPPPPGPVPTHHLVQVRASDVLMPVTAVPAAAAVPLPLNTRPFPEAPQDRRALRQANAMRATLKADLTRLNSHWLFRLGAHGRLERHVQHLRCLLQQLGYSEAEMPPTAADYRCAGVSRHAWQPQWAQAVAFRVGQLFSTGDAGAPPVVLEPLPAPVPIPPSEPDAPEIPLPTPHIPPP